MRLFPAFFLICLAVSAPLTALQESPSSSRAVLPSVTSYSLDKAKVTLPADFTTSLNLLILSFQGDQQGAAQSWLPVTADLKQQHPQLQVWVLPISSRENFLYRWWINTSMRNSLPAGQPRSFTVPLYLNNLPAFRKQLRISSDRQIVLLLTDKAGHVLWRGTGAVTDANKASLSAFLKSSP